MNKKTGLNWWCDRAWIHFGCIITAVMTILILRNWNNWSEELKIIATIAALLPIHVIEEWVFPGGFHYQYNLTFKSDQLDRYPMCRLSDMITNLAGTFYYAILTIICFVNGTVYNGIVMSAIALCFIELIIHTQFGLFMYKKFKSKGKTTIYGPGSITAYIGFGVLGVILVYRMIGKTIVFTDWIGCILLLLLQLVGFILLPEIIVKKKDNKYFFSTTGYFEKFL